MSDLEFCLNCGDPLSDFGPCGCVFARSDRKVKNGYSGETMRHMVRKKLDRQARSDASKSFKEKT